MTRKVHYWTCLKSVRFYSWFYTGKWGRAQTCVSSTNSNATASLVLSPGPPSGPWAPDSQPSALPWVWLLCGSTLTTVLRSFPAVRAQVCGFWPFSSCSRRSPPASNSLLRIHWLPENAAAWTGVLPSKQRLEGDTMSVRQQPFHRGGEENSMGDMRLLFYRADL